MGGNMKREYDFSHAEHGAIAIEAGKAKITLMLDTTVVEAARKLAEDKGIGCQSLINDVLSKALLSDSPAITQSKR